jgi:hypothetical protein
MFHSEWRHQTPLLGDKPLVSRQFRVLQARVMLGREGSAMNQSLYEFVIDYTLQLSLSFDARQTYKLCSINSKFQ